MTLRPTARIRTTNLQPSAFDRLSEPVRKWIWQQKWKSLRDVQEKAIPAVLKGGDVVVSAKTAAGKTEAAVLPLLTRIKQRVDAEGGFAVLYVSPLKALINDQYRRLQPLCEACDVMLHKWHGDVSADAKTRARRRPSGIVLITPESLEALLVRRGNEIRYLFSSLDAVVIDELHAFIGTERGMQLQSILNRIEIEAGRDRIDRIGLSATLGDMRLAAAALRPGKGYEVELVQGEDQGNGLKLQIRGYYENQREQPTDGAEPEPDEDTLEGQVGPERHGIPHELADDLFRFMRGSRNLLFAGSRERVEMYSDRLRTMCEDTHLPNEFFPHHGNLSKVEREDVEVRLRDDPRPTTAVATTTLELGIDIGDVETIGQIGPGFSVASLRQRLGRSGRRSGKPAVLRMFVIEQPPIRGRHPVDRLNLGLIQSIAMVECLRANWCEPPLPAGLHLSTLVHQILALILQTGGTRPIPAFKTLCERGPFKAVDRALFASLLRCMALPENKLIEQSPEGLLMVGEYGEKITESHEFYPVFMTEREYRIIHETQTLGTYPLESPLMPGETLIFAGRRWLVLEIDDAARVITVRPTRGGKPPYFSGSGGVIHDHVVATMRQVLLGQERYVYLDKAANAMLEDARTAYVEMGLDRSCLMPYGEGVLVLPWLGTRKLDTLALALQNKDFKCVRFSHAIELQECTLSGVETFLNSIADGEVPADAALVDRVAKPIIARFDYCLSPDLMRLVTIFERLEIDALPAIAKALVEVDR